MVGGDRRSPPRHRAKGGGGRGKGGNGGDELGFSFEGRGKIGSATQKSGEVLFRFGNEDSSLKSVAASDSSLQPNASPFGKDCLASTVGRIEFTGAKSWALDVEAQEELNQNESSPRGVATLVAGFEAGQMPQSDEFRSYVNSPIMNRKSTGNKDGSSSLAPQLQQANDSFEKMDCGISHGLPQVSVQVPNIHNLHKENASSGTQSMSQVTVGMQDFLNLHKNQGSDNAKDQLVSNMDVVVACIAENDVDLQVDSRLADADSDMKDSLDSSKCPSSVRRYEQTEVYGSVKQSSVIQQTTIPNSHCPVRDDGLWETPSTAARVNKEGNFMGSGVKNLLQHGQQSYVKTAPNTNAWKRPAHVKVKDIDLEFVSVDGHSLAFDEEAYESNKSKLERGLVGKLIGRRLPLHILDQELCRRWSHVGGFRTILIGGDCFLCIFESSEARDKILMGGPWQILGHVIGMDKWTPSFNPAKLTGLSSPIWIRLPRLPLLFWDNRTISRIGALIGTPLWIDAQTAVWGRCEYARICVRLDLAKKLPAGVWIHEKSSKFFQPIEYEGISILCFKCGIVGHKAELCTDGSVTNMAYTGGSSQPMNTQATGARSATKISKEASTSQIDEHSMPKTSGLPAQLDSLEGEKGYGPWILVTRKRKPVRNSGKIQPPNSRTPTLVSNGVVPPSLEEADKEDLVVESMVEGHELKAQAASTAVITSQTTVGSPPHHGTVTIVENLEAPTSRQPHNRSGKERISKAHFEKELLQLGPIALKSRKRKKKVTTGGSELCLYDFTHASDSGGGVASPSRGK